MSKVFATHDVLLNLTAWRNETTNPNVGAGTAGPIGSFWQRNGSYTATPATPVETYLKTGLDNFGWCKQNTVNLDIYNVKDYGAHGSGDPFDDDRAAIQAAITAANAAGGGTIYFPPGNYTIHRNGSDLGSFELANMSNLTFLGDGYASTLQMVGDAVFKTWYLFHVHDRSQRIVFNNLRFLGDNFDHPDGNQYFFIHISSNAPDIGPPHNIDIFGVWFDAILIGAPIKIVGELVGGVAFEPHDIRIHRNAFNVGDGGPSKARSALEGQRFSRKVQNHYNWMTGAKNSLIDCEPGGEGAPSEWSHVGNHLLYNGNSDSEAVNIRGRDAANPSQRTIFSFNTITNGGNVAGGFGSNLEMRGNIVVMAAASAFTEAVLYMLHNGSNLNIIGNILISPSVTGNRQIITLVGDATAEGASNLISDNICTGLSTTSDGSGMEITSNTEVLVNGNIVVFDCIVADQASGIKLRAIKRVGDHWAAAGNLVIGTNARLETGIRAAATGSGDFDIRNVAFCYNYARNTSTGMTFEVASGNVFLDGRECNNNNCVAASMATVMLPATNVGVTFEGNAGKGSQICSQAFAAGAEGLIVAAPGSLNANQSGLPGAVIQYKESGVAADGWFGLGSSVITFGARILSTATAARFLAPGSDLTIEGTAQIKLVMVRPGNIRNWSVVCTAGVGVSSITYTIVKNGISQSPAIVIANTATSGSTTGSFAVAAGDLIWVQVTKSAAPGTPQANVVVTLELTG